MTLLLGAYLPSLILLVYFFAHLLELYSVAKRKRSTSQNTLKGLLVVGSALVASWFFVLRMALILFEGGTPFVSWEILTLPIGWAIIMIFVNRWIRL
jgi:hypothetical protein